MKISLKLVLFFCMLLCLGNTNISKTNCIAFKKSFKESSLGTQEFNIDSILNAGVVNVMQCSKKDSIFYPLGNTVMEDDSSRIIAIVRFIDKEKIFAVDISSTENAIINFYCYENSKWNNIGCKKMEDDIFSVKFSDYSGDGINEIITLGHSNMNGNHTNNFFSYSNKSQTINFPGHFFAGVYHYNFNRKRKEIHVLYEGSWWMENSKTIYKWRTEKLIPVKEVVLELKIADMKHDAQFIKYYENPTYDEDTLVLKFKKTYNRSNKKLYNLWEHFFE